MNVPSLIPEQAHINHKAKVTNKSPALLEVELSDVMSSTLEPAKYSVNPWFPRRHVTLFGGHGGIGKSSLALTIGAHVACGKSFAGLEVERSTVLIVSLEDEAVIVRSRLRKIIESYDLPPQSVLERMRLLDGTETYAALMTESDDYNPQPVFTKAFRELTEVSKGMNLIIIDNASDAFDANENSRRAVRSFVRGLASLARRYDAAIVLLAHIDKASAKNGSQGNSYSGSTAWHNSARSRLAMLDHDGVITLTHEKANLSSLASPVSITFREGVPIAEATAISVGLKPEIFDQSQMIRAIRTANEAGIIVPAAMSGPSTAIHTLETLPEYGAEFRRGKAGKQRAKAAIVALIRSGKIKRVTYTTPQRNQREKLELTHDKIKFNEVDDRNDWNHRELHIPHTPCTTNAAKNACVSSLVRN